MKLPSSSKPVVPAPTEIPSSRSRFSKSLERTKWLPACAAMTMASMLGACARTSTPANAPAITPISRFVAIAHGRVDVQGGLVHVSSPRDGIVAELPGAVGDDVKAGDVLIVLDTKPAKMALDAARAELDVTEAQAAALRAKEPALKRHAARIDEAAAAGAATGQSADDAKQALSELAAEIAIATANVEAARQKVRQAEYEVDARTLRTPLAGRVIARDTHIGDVVSPSSGELVELLPAAPRIVRAELNEGFVDKVAVGMNAEIATDAEPDKNQIARVTRIGDVFGPSRLTESAQEITDTRDVECILELPNADFKVGQRVQVRFLPK